MLEVVVGEGRIDGAWDVAWYVGLKVTRVARVDGMSDLAWYVGQ